MPQLDKEIKQALLKARAGELITPIMHKLHESIAQEIAAAEARGAREERTKILKMANGSQITFGSLAEAEKYKGLDQLTNTPVKE